MDVARIAGALLFFPLFLGAARAEDNPERDPGELERGKVFVWRSADGLPYEYFVPADYDAERGANLTVVLHGNGLDHRWTFWNHPPGEFRPDDIVVSPDGTSPLNGVNEFLGEPDDAERFHEFLTEIEAHWNVRRTFLYGHSQGSFFVFYYAGEFPKDVDGICGHASGVWNWTKQGKAGHHQAIGIMHGTDDHVPYGQGWWGRKSYEEAKYPLVHLRTLFDWPHRPHWMQAESVLAWCESMLTDDADRLEKCVAELAELDRPMGVDWSALHAAAARLAVHEAATPKQQNYAKRVIAAVDDLVDEHLAALVRSLGKGKLDRLSDGDWAGRLIRISEDFRGVPKFEDFKKKHAKAFKVHEENAPDLLADYNRKKERAPKDAFSIGLELLESGFLHYGVKDVAGDLENLSQTLDLPKKERQRADELLRTYRMARESGFREYDALNAKAKL